MPEKPTLYLESTIPGYLAAPPSRDLIVAAHQQVTHAWWETARPKYEIYISEAVIAEVRSGEPETAAERLTLIESLQILALTERVEQTVRAYQEGLGLGRDAWLDIVHLAFASANRLDYLLTWNFKHLANGHVIKRLQGVNRELGLETPLVLTPEALLE